MLLLVCARGAGAQAASPFKTPVALAVDSSGNLYVADAALQQVFEVSLAGAVTVVAGTGVQGFGGDGGPATAALLNAPGGLAVGADGAVYIADTGNQRVRVVRGGMISTFAGSGARGFGGDGAGALAAEFSGPAGLAMDAAGGLMIADSGNHRVRRVAGGLVTTFAGSGVQGFGGDGGAATAAVLDTPLGVAVGADGRVWIADSRNNRVRVMGTDGVIQTALGSGVAGFGGDGGVGVVAQLAGPAGVVVGLGGAVMVADAANHRVRMLSAAGVVSTVAGNGVQGVAANAGFAVSTPVDSPVAVSVSAAGDVVFADSQNGAVWLVAADGSLRMLGVGASSSSLTLGPVGALTYGSGSLTAALVTSGSAAEGSVALLDGGVSVSSGTLAGGSVVLPTGSLAAGSHSLSASFGGDLLHAAAVSPTVSVVIAPLGIFATAADATVTYGAPLPSLSGTVTGVLARDASSVGAVFASSAVDLAPVGNYAISATLTGAASGNYSVAMSAGSGALHVVQAQPVVTLATQGSYAGLPILLNATVVSPTRGTPTGMVQFLDAGIVVAAATVVNGVASAAYLTPAAGTRPLTAMYVGDHNFTAANSAVSSVVVSALPDFMVAPLGGGAQTVQGGGLATYALTVTPQQGAFSGSVVFSATGLQPGATVSFSPVAVVPGSGAVSVIMSVHTVALSAEAVPMAKSLRMAGLVLGVLLIGLYRRRRRVMCLCCVAAISLAGCGTRTVADSSKAAQTYNITVTGTSTNLAGSVVTHTCVVNLTVE